MEGAASLGSRGFGAGVLDGCEDCCESLEPSWLGVVEGELQPVRSTRVTVSRAASSAMGRRGWRMVGLSVGWLEVLLH